MRKSDFFERNILNIFILLIGGFLLFAFLAPITAALGFNDLSKVIYEIYSYLCHQRSWRSIHIFDYQLAFCVRDTFIYLSLLVSLIITKYTNVKQLKWYIAILCVIPMALDGGIQTIAEILTAGKNVVQFYESNNLFRMITGTIFGYGVGLWMWPMLKEGVTFVKKEINIKINTAYLVGILLIANLFVYMGMVTVWDLTSPTIKPTNIFDSTAKPRATNIGRCLRAEDSTNPKKIPVSGCE